MKNQSVYAISSITGGTVGFLEESPAEWVFERIPLTVPLSSLPADIQDKINVGDRFIFKDNRIEFLSQTSQEKNIVTKIESDRAYLWNTDKISQKNVIQASVRLQDIPEQISKRLKIGSKLGNYILNSLVLF